jgi:acyl phosphate:glycerol-3-phosphate acyltransferase
MERLVNNPFLCVVIAYLIGSVSAATIVGRVAGNIDMRHEEDGRVSASAIYDKLGLVPFAVVVLMDASLAASAVMQARLFTDSVNMTMLAGMAAVAGHNWSIFLKFKGGLGATAIAGVLLALAPLASLTGMSFAAVILLLTRRSGLSTLLGIAAISTAIFYQNNVAILAVYPILLAMIMLVKKIQVARYPRAVR